MSKPTIMEKARATVVLDHPFFASILLRHPMVSDTSISTCCINGEGRIRYNPEFFESLTVKQAVWALCHEVLHYVGMDSLRVGRRDKKKWNYIADEWINDTLNKLGIGGKIEGCVDRPGASESTREQLYDMLPPDDEGGGGGGGNEPPKPGGGDDSGDPMEGDVEPSEGSESEMRETEAQVKMVLAEAAQAAKMRGKLPGVLQDFVNAAIDSKVPWYDVLERHMAGFANQEVSWSKPNRRYAPKFYLPSVQKTPSMGEIVLQIDVSGSVSAEEIRHYNGHVKRIVQQCNPEKVHVVYVDTDVVKHEEFEDMDDVEIRFHSGGGTDMPAGFKYLEKNGIEPDVLVCLTDGYTGWGEQPGFPVVWCISSAVEAPYGEVIHFDMHQ